ncbi:MAG: hypothetical protein Q7S40_15505 [Opitutaceae bacterium]|nr:hypothetical protein [Opitutaceae bacterium]
MAARTPTALGATKTTFANNILVGGGLAAKIDGPNTGAVWSGNLLWKTRGAGDLPASGFTEINPGLAKDAAGIDRLAPGSPAIDVASGDFPAVRVDFDGQPRSGKKDVGADEFSESPAGARILTEKDVGPGASDEN